MDIDAIDLRLRAIEDALADTRTTLEEKVGKLEEFTKESKRDRLELRESLKRGRWMRTAAWVAAAAVVILGTRSLEQQHAADRAQDKRADTEACAQRKEGREALRGLVIFVITESETTNPGSPGTQTLRDYLNTKLAPISCP